MTEEEKYYFSLRNYANKLAPYYDAIFKLLTFGTEQKLRDKVVDFSGIKSGTKILDIATGTGKQALAFANNDYGVTGIDLSEDMLRVARNKKRHKVINLCLADATHLPFKDNAFNATCVSFALHDMILTIREKTLQEMARVTESNGTIIIVDYALPKNRIIRPIIFRLVKAYEPYYPEFIKSDLETLIRKSGIEITDETNTLLGAARILKGIKTSLP